MMRVAIPFLVIVTLLLASCSGTTMNVGETESPDTVSPWHDASWDPMAPAVDVLPLEEALAAAPGRSVAGYTVKALGKANLVDHQVLQSLRLEVEGNTLSIYTDGELGHASLSVFYNPDTERVVRADVDREDALGMTVVKHGRVDLGIAGIGDTVLNPNVPLGTIEFTAGPETVARCVSKISQHDQSMVKDLEVVFDVESGNATLSWHERHYGEYNLDGLVYVSDMTPVGQYYNFVVDPEEDNWAYVEVVDGNENGLIEVGDITPIGQNYESMFQGYNIYRAPAPEGVAPALGDTSWVKIENATDPSLPTAPRATTISDKIRQYFIAQDAPEDSGSFAWYVVPAGAEVGGEREEGKPCDPVVADVGPPGVSLNLQIETPHAELLNTNDEFYIGVRVANVEGLFSANVRFEYDSTLVEFVETVPFYTDYIPVDHLNFLTPPLFVGGDVGDVGDGYRQVGFNATQRAGVDDPQTGEGMLGYVKFRAIAAGINDSCFRFPATTTFVYLWGGTYGVPVGAPELGEPVLVNIAD